MQEELFQIYLKNLKSNDLFVLETFPTETISTHETMINLVDGFRSKFKDIDTEGLILTFKKVIISDSSESNLTAIIIDNVDSFISESNFSNIDSNFIERKKISISTLEEYDFKI